MRTPPLPQTDLPVWEPQRGAQTLLCTTLANDVLMGGGKWGGKTSGVLIDYASYQHEYGAAAKGIVFRRSFPELDEIQQLSQQIFPGTGGTFVRSRREWRWPSGAFFQLRFLENEMDALRYQGRSFTYIAFDEAGLWPNPVAIDTMRACLRSPAGIPCLLRLTANPGGVGHQFLKARYIDPAPPYTVFDAPVAVPDGTSIIVSRLYLPSTMDDNPLALQKDPLYWQRVALSVGDNADLLRALRYGDWDVQGGGYFADAWNPLRHILRDFVPPITWRLFRTFDWGKSRPACLTFYAESDGEVVPVMGRGDLKLPRGSLVAIDEWYTVRYDRGGRVLPDTGLGLDNHELGVGIAQRTATWREKGYRITGCRADPSVFISQGGPSIYDQMRAAAVGSGLRWVPFSPADNKRVPGWTRLHLLLKAAAADVPETPGFWLSSACRHAVRTLGSMPRDPRNPDDVDTTAEDHAVDCARYAAMARPLIAGTIKVVGY